MIGSHFDPLEAHFLPARLSTVILMSDMIRSLAKCTMTSIETLNASVVEIAMGLPEGNCDRQMMWEVEIGSAIIGKEPL
jgi:hypothetical protein